MQTGLGVTVVVNVTFEVVAVIVTVKFGVGAVIVTPDTCKQELHAEE